MTRLTRFWLALEALPGQAAVAAQWRQWLQDEGERVAALFTLDGTLATTYPRLEGRSAVPFSVVEHGPDDYTGVCEEEGATVSLSQADLLVHRLDPPRLLRVIASAFGLGLDPSAVEGVPVTYHVGVYRPVAGFAFPVFLTIPLEALEYRQAVESIVARHGGPFLLFAPTNRFHRLASASLLQARGASFIPLADALGLDERGQWGLTEHGDWWLNTFRSGVLPTEGPVRTQAFFPTPEAATWSDVRIRFVDGHNVAVRVGDVTRKYHYGQLGMADGRDAKPTKQWELLRSLAEGHGRLTWQSRAADRKNQKRRELLAKDLKAFFRIDGEPLELTADKGGWRTVFVIEPDA